MPDGLARSLVVDGIIAGVGDGAMMWIIGGEWKNSLSAKQISNREDAKFAKKNLNISSRSLRSLRLKMFVMGVGKFNRRERRETWCMF